MSIDVIGDFLTIIRNGIMASKRTIEAPYSQLKEQVAKILMDEGFIRDMKVEDLENNKKKLVLVLKYVQGESVIHEIERVSTPGRRFYRGTRGFKPIIGGLGISIVTTNKGVMTNKQARKLGIGGEVLCTVW